MRAQRKRLRDDEAKGRSSGPAPLAQPRKRSAAAGVGSFYTDSALTLYSNHWQLLTLHEGATPGELLKRGIYSSIAVPLKGGEWRKASMVQLAMALVAKRGPASSSPSFELACIPLIRWMSSCADGSPGHAHA